MPAKPLLQMREIGKKFANASVLKNVDLSVYPGEVVALLGENGAGKSTLMNILGGIYQDYDGKIYLNGKEVYFPNVISSIEHGIGFIHQELNVIENLDVAGNIFLGREPLIGKWCKLVDKSRIYEMAQVYLEQIGFDMPADTPLAKLSIAQKQMVEIAKALSLDARVLIMDEPTSSLTMVESEKLFKIIDILKRKGVSIIYISHRLEEITKCADRVVGLRDGENSGVLDSSQINYDNMVKVMVGRTISNNYQPPTISPVADYLIVEDVRTDAWPNIPISFSAAKGEILGITGLVGAGRTELVSVIAGIDKAVSGGIKLEGRDLNVKSPAGAIAYGIYLVPEDRRNSGLIMEMSIKNNISLPSMCESGSFGFVNSKIETALAEKVCCEYSVKADSVEQSAANLSGGNQQKVVLAKWLRKNPKVIIFDEPTRGVDVGARSDIYKVMRKLTEQGVLVIMVSSDMEEIIGVSDRVITMCQGRITGIVERDDMSEDRLMKLIVQSSANLNNREVL